MSPMKCSLVKDGEHSQRTHFSCGQQVTILGRESRTTDGQDTNVMLSMLRSLSHESPRFSQPDTLSAASLRNMRERRRGRAVTSLSRKTLLTNLQQ